MRKRFSSFLKCLAIASVLYSCNSNLPSDVAEAYEQLPEKIDYGFDVKPILSDRCYACHGPDEGSRQAGLRLDDETSAFTALSNGKFPFVKNKPFQSESIKRILSNDPSLIMPTPESKISLTAKEKAIIVKWIEQGAEWKPHWSFVKPEKAALPEVKSQALVQNPIDHFVLQKLEQNKLTLSEKADKTTLLRRVYFDLIGLPPSVEAVNAFLKDESENAFEKVVDALLKSPRFGERWAWDWLDAARYADTNGFQKDPERKMWPWRTWVINAFNNNMPYDQFTIEQLAGDLMPNATTNQIIATAFNRNHSFNGEGGRIVEETRVENVFDRLETTGTIWMGLTFKCTRCHDHKFDPITQKEYFQFYDYFNQTSETGHSESQGMIPPVLDLSSTIDKEELKKLEDYLELLGNEITMIEDKKFKGKIEGVQLSPALQMLSGSALNQLKIDPSERSPYYLKEVISALEKTEPSYTKKIKELSKALNKTRGRARRNLRVMVMDELKEPRTTYILGKGIFDNHLDSVTAGVPAILPPLSADAPNNRLGLAKWLVSKEHPLTARVTVNRYWQAFFRNGLVKTPDDFGLQGSLPTHPELLDWLAVDFIENGWDLKRLFKQIVSSATYQQSSKVSKELYEIDPENKMLARAPRYRLPSWMMRDQALFASGLLKNKIGGKSVKPYQPSGIWEEASFGKQIYKQDHGDNLYRRTLYTFWKRIAGPTMLFDNATRQSCSVKQSLTNSPQHALVTMNDVTYLEAARVIAQNTLTQKTTAKERLDYAFKTITSRYPQEKEAQILQTKLSEFKTDFEDTDTKEVEDFIATGEFPVNKDLNKVDYAAYTTLCSMILNLDETITKQ